MFRVPGIGDADTLKRTRVLFSVTEQMEGPPAIEKELEPLTHASWADFTRFLNAHDKRRCDVALRTG